MAVVENDVQRLENALNTMKVEIIEKISGIEIDLAKHYLPKAECEKCKTEQSANKKFNISNLLVTIGILVSLVLGVINLVGG
ncbi:MAG: hypothetical protein WC834_00125 [Eubacteriales bacterium]